jgi:hypothetical protein
VARNSVSRDSDDSAAACGDVFFLLSLFFTFPLNLPYLSLVALCYTSRGCFIGRV